jgi:hypothetical protein
MKDEDGRWLHDKAFEWYHNRIGHGGAECIAQAMIAFPYVVNSR